MDRFPQTADRRPWWVTTLLIVVPAAAGIPLLLWGDHTVIKWAAYALCGLALYSLIPQFANWLGLRGDPVKVGPIPLSAWLPGLLIIAVAAGLLWPPFIGDMPQSQDHPVHLTRAWHFLTRMLPQGKLSGWSDLWFAGWPAGEDYPPAGDWLISTIYLLNFGLLGWKTSYGLAMIAMYSIFGLGIYVFGRHHFGKLVGLAAALMALLDAGAYREGGWNYTIWWGVWPQVLSTGFTMMSLGLLKPAIERGRPRDFALCGITVGLALVAHPVAVIYLGLAVPVYLLARIIMTKQPTGEVLARAAGALLLGIALSAFWVAPFIAKGSWMAKYGELWKSIPDISTALWTGTLFQKGTPALIWMGLLGGIAAVWRRSFPGVFLCGFAAGTLLLASSTAFNELDLLSWSPSFGQVQFQRLLIPIKICIYLLAGYSLHLLFQAGKRPQLGPARRFAIVILLLIVVSPFARPLAESWGRNYGGQLGRPKVSRDFHDWKRYEAFLAWSKGLKKKDDSFFRIAYVGSYNDHFFAAAPVSNGIPAYKVGFTPCTNFIHKPDVAHPELYKLLSVKYVVTRGGGAGPKTKLVKRFGNIAVYEFTDYSTQRYTVQGSAQVKQTYFDPSGRGMRFEVSNASASDRLILHVSNYANWRAYQNGKPVEITTTALANQNIFIGVPLTNGTLEFRYAWPAANVAGAATTWIGLGVLLLIGLRRFRPNAVRPIVIRLRPWGRRIERYGVLLAVIGLLGILGLFAIKRSTKARTVKKNTLLAMIDKAVVTMGAAGRPKPCKRRGNRHICSDKSWNYVGRTSERIGERMRRCIWAHPVDRQELRVTFPDVKLGNAISGHHGLTDNAAKSYPGGSPVKLVVEIDGKVRGTFNRSNRKGWDPWKVDTQGLAGQPHDITLVISTKRAGGRHYCFDADL